MKTKYPIKILKGALRDIKWEISNYYTQAIVANERLKGPVTAIEKRAFKEYRKSNMIKSGYAEKRRLDLISAITVLEKMKKEEK